MPRDRLRIEDKSHIKVHLRPKNIPNPQDAYNEIVDILVMRNNFGKNDIREQKYEHEMHEDSEVIRAEIRAYKPKDRFSYIYIKTNMKIEMRPTENEEYDYVGDLEVRSTGKVRTEYPQKSAFQRSILWHAFRAFYEKVLYGDVRQNYMNECDEYMRVLRDELKSYFDMLPTIR